MGVLLLSPQKMSCRCLAGYLANPNLLFSLGKAVPLHTWCFLTHSAAFPPSPPVPQPFPTGSHLWSWCLWKSLAAGSLPCSGILPNPLEFLLDEKLLSTTCPKSGKNVGMLSWDGEHQTAPPSMV